MKQVSKITKLTMPFSFCLTAREKEILYYVAIGESDKKIADRLKLSAKTVNNHVDHALVKLAAANRTNGIAKAILLGLIQPRLSDVMDRNEAAPQMLARGANVVDVRFEDGRYVANRAMP